MDYKFCTEWIWSFDAKPVDVHASARRNNSLKYLTLKRHWPLRWPRPWPWPGLRLWMWYFKPFRRHGVLNFSHMTLLWPWLLPHGQWRNGAVAAASSDCVYPLVGKPRQRNDVWIIGAPTWESDERPRMVALRPSKSHQFIFGRTEKNKARWNSVL